MGGAFGALLEKPLLFDHPGVVQYVRGGSYGAFRVSAM